MNRLDLLPNGRVRIVTYAMFGLARRTVEAETRALRFAPSHSGLLPSSFSVAGHRFNFLLDYKAGIVHDNTALQRLARHT